MGKIQRRTGDHQNLRVILLFLCLLLFFTLNKRRGNRTLLYSLCSHGPLTLCAVSVIQENNSELILFRVSSSFVFPFFIDTLFFFHCDDVLTVNRHYVAV